MKTRYWVFLTILGTALAYEVYALTTRDEGDTISEITWNTTKKYPLLPFSVGVLMGHFFWQRGSNGSHTP